MNESLHNSRDTGKILLLHMLKLKQTYCVWEQLVAFPDSINPSSANNSVPSSFLSYQMQQSKRGKKSWDIQMDKMI